MEQLLARTSLGSDDFSLEQWGATSNWREEEESTWPQPQKLNVQKTQFISGDVFAKAGEVHRQENEIPLSSPAPRLGNLVSTMIMLFAVEAAAKQMMSKHLQPGAQSALSGVQPERRVLTRDSASKVDPSKMDRGKTISSGDVVVVVDKLDQVTREVLKEMDERMLSDFEKVTADLSPERREQWKKIVEDAQGPQGLRRDVARHTIAANVAQARIEFQHQKATVTTGVAKVATRGLAIGLVLREILAAAK